MKYIYLHGLGQTPDSWNRVLGYRNAPTDSICPDLAELVRGREANYSDLYAAFSALCNTINDDFALCGLSLGGVLALNYAIDHPEKVRSLVLIATPYKMPKQLLQLQNILFRFMPKSSFSQTGFQKADFIRLCRSMTELDFSRSLSRVACPVLVLCGENDRANQRACKMPSHLLPDAKFQLVPRAGHEVNVDAPEALAKILHENWNDTCKRTE